MKKSELKQIFREEIGNILKEEQQSYVTVYPRYEETFDEFFEEFGYKPISKKTVSKPKEMFGMGSNAVQYSFKKEDIDNIIKSIQNYTDLEGYTFIQK